jgi:hypothetical protein
MEPLLAFFLFVLLSPGFIVTIPPKGSSIFGSNETSQIAIIVHTVFFFTLNKFIQTDFMGLSIVNRAVREVTSTNSRHVPSDVNVLLATLMFLIFSPGLILTLVPFSVGEETTSNLAVIAHGFIYYIFLKVYDEYKGEVWLKWLDDAIAQV